MRYFRPTACMPWLQKKEARHNEEILNEDIYPWVCSSVNILHNDYLEGHIRTCDRRIS